MTISVLDKDGNPQTLDPPTQTTLAAILAKLSSDPATQTTLAAILAKLIAAPATEAKQDAIVTALGALATAANQSTANTTLATLLTAGTPITGQSLESGGAGALGWLASIRKKIAAFGTAGAPSADVITVQGITNGTPLPITAQGTPTDRSSTLTTGGTAQQLAAANTSRKYLLVQNQSSGYLYIRFTGTATQDQTSLRIESGGSYENPPHYCPTSAVSIIGATTGQAWHSVEA